MQKEINKAGVMLDAIGVRDNTMHRYPFLMVDRVTDMVINKSIKGFKNISISEGLLQGHFPQLPIFPGVMTVEALAQLSGILIRYSNADVEINGIPAIVAIDDARFKKKVLPGDRLDLYAELLSGKKKFWKFKTLASVEGSVVAQATIMFTIIDT